MVRLSALIHCPIIYSKPEPIFFMAGGDVNCHPLFLKLVSEVSSLGRRGWLDVMKLVKSLFGLV